MRLSIHSRDSPLKTSTKPPHSFSRRHTRRATCSLHLASRLVGWQNRNCKGLGCTRKLAVSPTETIRLVFVRPQATPLKLSTGQSRIPGNRIPATHLRTKIACRRHSSPRRRAPRGELGPRRSRPEQFRGNEIAIQASSISSSHPSTTDRRAVIVTIVRRQFYSFRGLR